MDYRLQYLHLRIPAYMGYFLALVALVLLPFESRALECWPKQASQLGADLWKVPVNGAEVTIRLDRRGAEEATLGVKTTSIGDDYTNIPVPNGTAGKVEAFLQSTTREGQVQKTPVVAAYYFQGILAVLTRVEPRKYMVVRKNGESECKTAFGDEDNKLTTFFKQNGLRLVIDSAVANSDEAVGAALGFGEVLPKNPGVAGRAQLEQKESEGDEFTPEFYDALDDAITNS